MKAISKSYFILFATCTALLTCVPAFSAKKGNSEREPKTSVEWFQRARDQMNLRMPGSAPFHMRVSFHALPGEELLGPKEKPQIIVGDGTYQEIWLAPHQWRREVTLADYHAVEVESEKGRKFQASSPYEPSRVLMLLNALLEPIPRNVVSREYGREGVSGWSVDHLSSGNVSLVRIDKSTGDQRGTFDEVFYFLPGGLLVLGNEYGLSTKWQNQTIFSGKIVPRNIVVQAAENRNLLTAEVTIEPAPQTDPAQFDLPTGFAEPGQTMRPIKYFEIKQPRELSPTPDWSAAAGNSAITALGVIDRTGVYRELEVLLTTTQDFRDKNGDLSDQGREDKELLDEFRASRWAPAEIDGSPCEYALPKLYDRHTYVEFGPVPR